MTMQITAAAGATDVGHVRDNNEDAYILADRVWALADGLGGHAGGEVASSVAVNAAVKFVEAALSTSPHGVMNAAFREAHNAVVAAAVPEPSLADMGTTLVLAWLTPAGELRIGNVGDSRAYVLTGDRLELITIDDNHAQELLDRGELTAEEARVHPGRFWLSAALGLGEAQAPRPRQHVLATSGRLLLCSDGLSSELSHSQIAALLAEDSPKEASKRLVEAALDAGGSDNVTVVVVDLFGEGNVGSRGPAPGMTASARSRE